MLENLKDNLIVTKDNQFAPFEFKIHQSIQEVAKNKSQKMQQNFEKNQKQKLNVKAKEQGKQQMQQQLQQANQKEHENISFGR